MSSPASPGSPGSRKQGLARAVGNFVARTNATSPRGDDPVDSGIKVMVRVRPFQEREQRLAQEETSRPAQAVVEAEGDYQTVFLVDHLDDYKDKMPFHFDYCFTAFKPRSITFDAQDDTSVDSAACEPQDTQEEVFAKTGLPALDNAWEGYNACVFAYGQTSSGKTYTMMGTKPEPGIIPRLCRALFEKVETVLEEQKDAKKNKKTINISVSFMEIYNEQVKDLLRPSDKSIKQYSSRFDDKPIGQEYQNLRVRNHPLHGPFVEGITKRDVETWGQCVDIIRMGNSARAQSSTQMNDTSSRSHAIFQIWITQTEHLGAKMKGQPITSNRTAKLNLVDLAGSERTGKTDVKGKQLTEANYINKSLMTLRKVIDTLVGNAQRGLKDAKLPPYRESLLTWILADNFGGNAKTVMIANVSPFYQNISETESTLRYATTAKGVVNRVRVNEDASAKLIRELQTQIRDLQREAKQAAEMSASATRIKELEEEITLSNKAIEELRDREQDLQKMTEAFMKREKELLEERAKWKAKARELEGETQQLRAKIEKLQQPATTTTTTTTTSNPAATPSLPNIHTKTIPDPLQETGSDDDLPLSQQPSSTSLRGTRLSKAHFWLDDNGLPEGGQQASSSVKDKKKKAPLPKEKERRKSAQVLPTQSGIERVDRGAVAAPKAGRRARGDASSQPPPKTVVPIAPVDAESSPVITGRAIGSVPSASASPADAPREAPAVPPVRKGRKREDSTVGSGSGGAGVGVPVPGNGAPLQDYVVTKGTKAVVAPPTHRDALDEMLTPTTMSSGSGTSASTRGSGKEVGDIGARTDKLFKASSGSASLLRMSRQGKNEVSSPTHTPGTPPPRGTLPFRSGAQGPSTAPVTTSRSDRVGADPIDALRRQGQL